MVDPDRLRRLLQAVEGYRGVLERLRDLPVETYVAEESFGGRYLVQATAQTCIDAANHVIASEGWRAPRDYRDAFTVLEEHELLAPDLAGRLRALAGLRNRLVHLYADIDDRLVHGYLAAGGLDDVQAFAATLARLAVQADDTGDHGQDR